MPAAFAWLTPNRAAMLLVCSVAAVYLPSIDASFQFDDFKVVVNDPRVQSLHAWIASMPAIRPLLRLSFALNHEFHAGSRGFRSVNVLIHAANAVMVLALLSRLARARGLDPQRAVAVGFIAALIFALHPAATEAVTYVSGRSSSLVTLASLGALLMWVRSFDHPGHAPATLGLAGAAALVALGCKETAVVLPLAMLLWSAATDAGDAVRRGRELRSVAVIALTIAVAAAGLWLATPYHDIWKTSLSQRTPWQNVMTQANALPHLLGHLVRLDDLNADPDVVAVTRFNAATAWRLAAGAAILAMSLSGFKRHPAAAFGILWAVLWLLPTNSVFSREDIVNDRQLYAAMVGPCWLVGWGTVKCAAAFAAVPARRAWIVNAVVLAALMSMSATLATSTLKRNAVYATEVSFWEDAARRSPEKSRVANNLGFAYALECRDDEALAEFDRSLRLDPADFTPYFNRRFLAAGTLFQPGERACDRRRGPPSPASPSDSRE